MAVAAVKISLVPSELDLDLYAGDGVSLVFTLSDSDGQPLNVTGAVTAQLRATRGDIDPSADFTADLTNGAQGEVVLSLSGAQTQALIGQKETFEGVWDMQWTRVGSEPVTVLQGKVTCVPDVTR
jgi:hypothetical protein